jgi:lincosamide and streptogramin A transport system ATP-binding/permease protein
MSQIKINNLTFAYPGSYDNVFENASFQIDTDWKLGFTGRNGRGKTTFLKLLMGEYSYHGSITANVVFDYFPFPVPHQDWLAGEALEEVCPEVPRWRLLREMSALQLGEEQLYRPFGTLSNGERTKCLLALLFARENHFLLIDEPTNHLDLRGRELVSRYLNSKKGFILVSHDRAFLDRCVDHILSINKATIEVQRGNFSSWWENKARQDQFELAENEKLKKEIRRLKDAAREKAQWSDAAERRKTGVDRTKVDNVKGWAPLQGAKSKKQMARAKAIEGRQQAAIEEKSMLLKNLEEAEALKLTQLPYHSERMLWAKDLTVDYGTGPVFENISFELHQGDRLVVNGSNGSGKSSLLKLVCGEEIPYTGIFERGSRLRISYVPQDTGFLHGNPADFARERKIDESLFKAILRKLDFSRTQFEKDMADYSAGQKKKVLLAASLCEHTHLHIWDEPMNYIDVLSRIQLEELLLAYRPTLLFVEHDQLFCEKIATKTLSLTEPAKNQK